jgi:hypothetical protein
MSDITPYQQTEIAEIVNDALAVTPTRYQANLIEAFGYLALCYVQERELAHLGDIQKLIDAAKADDRVALARMQSQLNAEITQLRGEMRLGFEKVADCLSVLDNRQSALEQRLTALEQRSLEPQVVYVESQPTVVNHYTYTDNSDNRRYNRTEGGNIEAFAWAIVILFFTALICTLLPQSLGGTRR